MAGPNSRSHFSTQGRGRVKRAHDVEGAVAGVWGRSPQGKIFCKIRLFWRIFLQSREENRQISWAAVSCFMQHFPVSSIFKPDGHFIMVAESKLKEQSMTFSKHYSKIKQLKWIVRLGQRDHQIWLVFSAVSLFKVVSLQSLAEQTKSIDLLDPQLVV